MNLEAAKYANPQRIKLNEEELALVGTGYQGITTSTCARPILGTDRLDTCIGMILYNPRKKMASCRHGSTIKPIEAAELLKVLRDDDSDPVIAHFCGLATEVGCVDSVIRLREIDELAQFMGQLPNLTIETFDINKKPHPTGFAIDTRNGKLVQLTSMVTEMNCNRPEEIFYTRKTGGMLDFDGRTEVCTSRRMQ